MGFRLLGLKSSTGSGDNDRWSLVFCDVAESRSSGSFVGVEGDKTSLLEDDNGLDLGLKGDGLKGELSTCFESLFALDRRSADGEVLNNEPRASTKPRDVGALSSNSDRLLEA